MHRAHRINSRLRFLEKRVAPTEPQVCAVCGLPLPGARWKGPTTLCVGWWSPGEPAKPPCAACGQHDTIRIEFDRAG